MRIVPGVAVSLLVLAITGTQFLLAATGRAGSPDPAKWLLHETGFWALVFLLASLSVSTLRRRLHWPAIARWRRATGLAGFALAALHLFVYAVPYQALDLPAILEDIGERPYILIGTMALALLSPLALTSTRAAQRRLGRRWQVLHRAAYVVLPLAVLHQAMAQKADLGQTLVFCAFLGCFLFERALFSRKKRIPVDS